jgi:hypothetical protein
LPAALNSLFDLSPCSVFQRRRKARLRPVGQIDHVAGKYERGWHRKPSRVRGGAAPGQTELTIDRNPGGITSKIGVSKSRCGKKSDLRGESDYLSANYSVPLLQELVGAGRKRWEGWSERLGGYIIKLPPFSCARAPIDIAKIDQYACRFRPIRRGLAGLVSMHRPRRRTWRPLGQLAFFQRAFWRILQEIGGKAPSHQPLACERSFDFRHLVFDVHGRHDVT